jgi:hypothetical protein
VVGDQESISQQGHSGRSWQLQDEADNTKPTETKVTHDSYQQDHAVARRRPKVEGHRSGSQAKAKLKLNRDLQLSRLSFSTKQAPDYKRGVFDLSQTEGQIDGCLLFHGPHALKFNGNLRAHKVM